MLPDDQTKPENKLYWSALSTYYEWKEVTKENHSGLHPGKFWTPLPNSLTEDKKELLKAVLQICIRQQTIFDLPPVPAQNPQVVAKTINQEWGL